MSQFINLRLIDNISLLFRSNRQKQLFLLKEIGHSMQIADRNEIQMLLHFLSTSVDIEVQVKLFSILATYLVSVEINTDIIITYDPLYDQIYKVLSRGLPQKTTVTLHFLCALLHFEDDDAPSHKRNLAMHARNTVRASGCLTLMANNFTNKMMYQDTFKALTNCLAEACRASDDNQNYCSHLIPLCIKKCKQENIDVFNLLQSLLSHNNRNLKLFFDNDGISVFESKFLHYDTCMQLLNSVTRSSSKNSILFRETKISKDLYDILHLYGPYSQLGQWATIILYNINSDFKGISKTVKSPPFDHVNEPINKTKVNVYNDDPKDLDNSLKLLHNVVKEIMNWKALGGSDLEPSLIWDNTKLNNTRKTNQRPLQKKTFNDNIFKPKMNNHAPNSAVPSPFDKDNNNNKMNNDTPHDFSLSFLKPDNIKNITKTTPPTFKLESKCTESRNSELEVNEFSKSDLSLLRSNESSTTIFQPMFVSTPKSKYQHRNLEQSIQSFESKRKIHRSTTPKSKFRQRNMEQSIQTFESTRKIHRKRVIKRKPLYPMNKPEPLAKHRSLSSRFFNVINDSCTSLVKTVKNIFKPRDESLERDATKSFNGSCSYSFTEYMKNRDAILASDQSDKDSMSLADDSLNKLSACLTCNDTLALKQKITNDELLRQTVKKLKLGINLYGCDFKKISKTIWPRENYMTPSVLYNLYRKLIVK